jgi:hypothetical protein
VTNMDLPLAARLNGDNQFKAWLDAERVEATKQLVAAVDIPLVYRAQGRLLLIEDMYKQLARK